MSASTRLEARGLGGFLHSYDVYEAPISENPSGPNLTHWWTNMPIPTMSFLQKLVEDDVREAAMCLSCKATTTVRTNFRSEYGNSMLALQFSIAR